MMEHMGYGNQPYFVYKHKDLDRVHYHVVSTRVDSVTGKKIKDNYEQQKMQRFILGLEQKYDLKQEKELVRQVEVQVTTGFKELFKKYRFCDAQNAAQELKEKGLLLFWSSESGNYKIFSPDNKIVFSNPFLIDKQLIRLDYFNMTNHDFYAIIKDYNRVLSEKFRFVSEGLIDYEKVSMLELKNPDKQIQLKEIKLSESKVFNQITSGMDDLSKSFTESAIKDYYRYSIRRIIETEQRIIQYDFYREYNQNRKSLKPGLTNDLSEKYMVVKTEDQYYLNNHPSGIQKVSLNPEQLKYHLDTKNFFSKSILEMLRLMPWYSKEKEQNKKKKMLKHKRKGMRF